MVLSISHTPSILILTNAQENHFYIHRINEEVQARRLNNLLKVTQLVSGNIEAQTQVYLIPKLIPSSMFRFAFYHGLE